MQWWKHVFGKVEPFKYHTKNYIQSTWFQYKYNIKVFMIWAKKYFKYISMCPLTKKDVWLYQVFCHEAKRGKLKLHGIPGIFVVSKEKTSKYDSHLQKESALLLMIMIRLPPRHFVHSKGLLRSPSSSFSCSRVESPPNFPSAPINTELFSNCWLLNNN